MRKTKKNLIALAVVAGLSMHSFNAHALMDNITEKSFGAWTLKRK